MKVAYVLYLGYLGRISFSQKSLQVSDNILSIKSDHHIINSIVHIL